MSSPSLRHPAAPLRPPRVAGPGLSPPEGGWLHALGHRSPDFIATVSGLAVLVLGVLNALIDAEVTFSVFYLVPIGVVSWHLSRSAGVVYSFLCAAVWLMARIESGVFHANVWLESWDAAVRLGLFLAVALLLSALRAAFERERTLARTDPLTGARNSRAFQEAAEKEIARARLLGRPYTLAYLDLDNFKAVNDRLGHSAGDRLLCAVGEALLGAVRGTDLVARLGGDEFAVLFPDTGADAVPGLLERLRANVREVTSAVDCPVTFSLGAMTCTGAEGGVEEALHAADALMYRVKHGGKDGMALGSYDAPEAAVVH